MAQALALLAARVLEAGVHALRVLDQSPQLGQAGLGGGRTAGQLLVSLPRRTELAPRDPRIGPPTELVVAAERVEHRELI